MQAQRDAGSPVYDAARFVARARLLTEWEEPPTIAPNDKCDIMGESLGGHVNTCDEWRVNGDHQVEIVDLAPTVMALLGLVRVRARVRAKARVRVRVRVGVGY